jgi:hypothetical protein
MHKAKGYMPRTQNFMLTAFVPPFPDIGEADAYDICIHLAHTTLSPPLTPYLSSSYKSRIDPPKRAPLRSGSLQVLTPNQLA